MRIRVMGTEEECRQAQRYYRQFGRGDQVEYCSVSELYPNRGSKNMYRVYIEISTKQDYCDVMNSKSVAVVQ